jgi:flagellar basal body-associated protein FliL
MTEEIQAEGIDDGGEDAGEGGEGVEDGAARRSIRKPIAIVAAAILVVAVAAGGVSYLVWGGDEEDHDPGSATIDLGGPLVYHELPEFLVDLQSDGRRSHHIKLQIVAELPEDHVPRITSREIGVIDAVLAHLRKQSRDDLTGEAAAERLRSDLVAVINGEIAPAQVRTILFKRFLMD